MRSMGRTPGQGRGAKGIPRKGAKPLMLKGLSFWTYMEVTKILSVFYTLSCETIGVNFPRKSGAHNGECRARAYTGVLGRAPSGVQGRAPGHGVRMAKPPEAEGIFHFHKCKWRTNCPNLSILPRDAMPMLTWY